jgi:hypothetical protein
VVVDRWASFVAPELRPTATPLTGLLTPELGFVSSESRRCGGWVDRLYSIEHSYPTAVWPVSPFIDAFPSSLPSIPLDLWSCCNLRGERRVLEHGHNEEEGAATDVWVRHG